MARSMVKGGAIGRTALRALCAAVIGCCAAPAHAQVEVRALLDVLRTAPGADAGSAARELPSAFRAPGTGLLSVLVELPKAARPGDFGLVAVAPGFAALEAGPDELARVAKAHPEWHLTWSPPRRPLLDQAAQWIRVPRADPAGPRGRGVVVGIVDTGIDPTHYDLRDEQRKSRVRWLLDFSAEKPAGRHPELEEEYGCNGAVKCAIFDNNDLDELNENQIERDEPQDTFGHGTHVASLAAGNGLGGVSEDNPVRKYVGAAPEATLISVRATRAGGGSIFDADILRATRFIFDQAERLGMPAVVNLSLGSEFGSHDGTAALERGLAALLEPDVPGRSIVVAAGNSAGVQFKVTKDYPEPLGIHTEVHVPRYSETRVPLLTPPSSTQKVTAGTIFVWIALRPGDQVDVGVDDKDEEIFAPLEPGHAGTVRRGELAVTVLNGTHGGSSPISADTQAAVVFLEGKWDAGSPFAIRLRGHGTARLWVQSEGDIGPSSGSSGALFPRAYKSGTISIPASHPLLIAVGATLNRLEWPVHTGKHTVKIDELGALKNPPADTIAFFSAAGPSANGLMKPDIVAPGAFVVGAMSRLADPRVNGQGIFGATERCRQPDGSVVECNVVDAWHAVTSGTSMAAPLVAGSIALLFERNPRLTQRQILDLLQGGARRTEGLVPLEEQLGPGALDVSGALSALDARDMNVVREPSIARSWLALASSFIPPDPDWPLAGSVLLRDADGAPADNFGFDRLRLEAAPALIKDPLHRVGPGLFRFAIAAPAESGGQRLRVRVLLDDQVLAERELPIAVDRSVVDGSVDARGGCSFATGAGAASALWVAALALLLRRRRRAQSLAR